MSRTRKREGWLDGNFDVETHDPKRCLLCLLQEHRKSLKVKKSLPSERFLRSAQSR